MALTNDNFKPGLSVETKGGDLLTVGQRVVTDDGMQGAVALIGNKDEDGKHGDGKDEVVKVELDEAVGTGEDKTRWGWFSPDSLRLL
jgi:hypothetical protein